MTYNVFSGTLNPTQPTTEAHRCEQLAQSFYAACPAQTRTHDLLIASATLYRQRNDATHMCRGQEKTDRQAANIT